MNKEFNKGLLLAGFGSFWWGFFGVIYFKYIYYIKILTIHKNDGGETGIRTQERVAPLPVFKTGAFNRSAISP